MARTFAYCRVSTADQTTDNQIREIEAAGFAVETKRVVSETVSGSTAAMERKGFARLFDRLEAGDVLVVTKLDRLGRNAMDVRATVEALAGQGVRVHCLALGGVDLTSPAGKMTMSVIAAVAEFERDLLVERTQAGLTRAKAEGKSLGRPSALSPAQQEAIRTRRAAGVSLGALAKEYGVSRAAIQRVEKRPAPGTFTITIGSDGAHQYAGTYDNGEPVPPEIVEDGWKRANEGIAVQVAKSMARKAAREDFEAEAAARAKKRSG